jgi:hypothetical protein
MKKQGIMTATIITGNKQLLSTAADRSHAPAPAPSPSSFPVFHTFLKEMKTLLLLLCLAIVPASCDIGSDICDCPYNVQLEYRYHRDGLFGYNELGYYVASLKEFIFDESDILIAANSYNVPHGSGEFLSEQMFQPGRYTAITWGNWYSYETAVEEAVVGVTTKQEMLMFMNHPQDNSKAAADTASVQGYSDRLYYSYRTFTVRDFGITRISMDLTNAHCLLNISAVWNDASGHPRIGDDYFFVLKQTPSLYHFTPEALVRNRTHPNEYDGQDDYLHNDNTHINYIPRESRSENVVHVSHGTIASEGRRNVLYTQFITFRYRNDAHVSLSIILADGQPVTKEIDLCRFFNDIGINLNYALLQEYNIRLEITGDRVLVSLVTIDDWDDGGML